METTAGTKEKVWEWVKGKVISETIWIRLDKIVAQYRQ